MTFPNHVAGGIVFTGTFCSLFNVNIFDNPYSIGLTIFASILPDIDHTKSLIGKLFFPVSKWLSIKFGHRTITHSLLFFVISSVLFLFSEKIFFSSSNYTLIFSFALLSHLVLDMLTVQGIPLFYPFARNPCVIPANPDLRINSGNIKSEGIALFLFTGMALFLQPLFANGFWTTYNNQFDSIGHIFREFSSSEKALVINYDYSYYNQNIQNSGILIKATQKELQLISNDSLVVIQSEPNTQIKALKAVPTDRKLEYKKVVFQDIIIDSLMYIVENKYILEGNIFSNKPILFEGKKTQQIMYSEVYNPNLPMIVNEENKDFIQIQRKYSSESIKVSSKASKKRNLEKHLVKLKEQLKETNLSNYDREKIGAEIIAKNKEYQNIEIDYSDLRSAELEYKNFPEIGTTKFNGVITYLKY